MGEDAKGSERDATDARLAAERGKTDAELGKRRTAVEQAADDVVDLARDRAESTLRTARALADREADGVVGRDLQRERAAEDAVVAGEHLIADDARDLERRQRAQALAALLRLEREATDEGLLVERARADEQVATRDDFLAIVSHDLRSMLGGIALSATMLATEPSAKVHAERIQRFTARMNRLVGDLLDVVSLEAGQLHVTLAPDDLGDVVRAAIETFAPAFASRGIELTGADAISSPVELDRDRILQVLANLLGNALKFTPRGGTVAVHVADADDGIRVSVVDTGPGIPAGKEAAIFDRFEQAGARDRTGVGLGLYIAKAIVDAHHGSIWAERAAGGGAALHFVLPHAAR